MSRNQQRLTYYLLHIMEAIQRIDRYTENMNEMAFLNNPLVQDAVVRNIEIIGEASHHIEKYYPNFVTAHPEIPLPFAYQMHNAVAHGYFKIDFEIVWQTLQRDIPEFYKKIIAVQKESAEKGDQF